MPEAIPSELLVCADLARLDTKTGGLQINAAPMPLLTR
jgi:hypothetical protein